MPLFLTVALGGLGAAAKHYKCNFKLPSGTPLSNGFNTFCDASYRIDGSYVCGQSTSIFSGRTVADWGHLAKELLELGESNAKHASQVCS